MQGCAVLPVLDCILAAAFPNVSAKMQPQRSAGSKRLLLRGCRSALQQLGCLGDPGSLGTSPGAAQTRAPDWLMLSTTTAWAPAPTACKTRGTCTCKCQVAYKS